MRFRQTGFLFLFCALLVAPSIAHADTFNIGLFSLVTTGEAGPETPGTVGFSVGNFTGSFALPPDFNVFTDLTFQNLQITYVIGGNSQQLLLPDLAPGSYFPDPGEQFPDTTLFDSATLTGTITPAAFVLDDASAWQANSASFTAVLAPASGPTLIPDLDLVVITIDADKPASTVPEPATVLLAAAGITLVLHLRRTRA